MVASAETHTVVLNLVNWAKYTDDAYTETKFSFCTCWYYIFSSRRKKFVTMR